MKRKHLEALIRLANPHVDPSQFPKKNLRAVLRHEIALLICERDSYRDAKVISIVFADEFPPSELDLTNIPDLPIKADNFTTA